MMEKSRLGMTLFLLSESVFFLLLVIAYIRYHREAGNGPTAAGTLDIWKTGIYSLFLFSSSASIWRAGRHFVRRQHRRAALWLGVTVTFGAVFLVGQGLEYSDLIHRDVTISRNLFGTTFFTLTGFHGLHVLVGLLMLVIVLVLAARGPAGRMTDGALEAVSLYWHFVDGVWVVIFSVVYLWAFL